MRAHRFGLAVAAIVLCAAMSMSTVFADSVTGTENGASIQFAANSTNALNYAQQTPGRVGQIAPFVLFQSATPNSVTLNFNNGAAGVEYFEYRIDGVDVADSSPATAHAVVAGDIEHTGIFLNANTTNVSHTFSANNKVEVRLALGAEADWRFNWTQFNVAPVPLPSAAWMGLTLLGVVAAFGIVRKRQLFA